MSRLIRLWKSDKIGFKEVDPVELELLRADQRKRSSGVSGRGPSRFRGKRRPMRGIATVGLKAKGPIKSPEFVLDSDTEEVTEGNLRM